MKKIKPLPIDAEMLEYLDALRKSGVTNMFGAAPYLERAYGLTPTFAKQVLSNWMATFSERHPETFSPISEKDAPEIENPETADWLARMRSNP